jgi:hypothetical protein
MALDKGQRGSSRLEPTGHSSKAIRTEDLGGVIEAHDHSHRTADDEDELVRVQLGVGRAVTETVGEERAEDGAQTVGRVPDVVPERLLPTSPPHRDDDEHRRSDRGLKGTEDESEDGQTGKVLERGEDTARDTPAEEAEADPPVDGELDQGVDGDCAVGQPEPAATPLKRARRDTHEAGRQVGQSTRSS